MIAFFKKSDYGCLQIYVTQNLVLIHACCTQIAVVELAKKTKPEPSKDQMTSRFCFTKKLYWISQMVAMCVNKSIAGSWVNHFFKSRRNGKFY
jgi:hypothetical protein